MQPAHTSDRETLELWYELGRLYSGSEGATNRATMLGFTVVCVAGAMVLLSGYFFGTDWAESAMRRAFGAALLPVVIGVLGGAVVFGRERWKLRQRREVLRRALAEKGEDAECPARDGLHAYYDAQLVLLRSEYEFLLLQGSQSKARLFEETFGFMPEDPFETGPLNVTPDSEDLRRLRGLWERRISMRRERGLEPPALGIREGSNYRVFPREMTVPAELATRNAYLTISCDLIKRRYGKNPLGKAGAVPTELQRRVEKDLGEHAALTRKV
ncbi:MAG: hypothetical protein WA982_07185 [Rubrobacteraceae bacterium]